MRLLQLIQIIEDVASSQTGINMIVRNSVLQLNNEAANKYGAFVWTQGQHTASVDTDMMRYRFTLFYIDRVVRDKANISEIQSMGVDLLNNIIRTLVEKHDVDVADWSLDTFTQRFADDCAGTYATVEISAPASQVCAEINGGGYLLTREGWRVVDADGLNIIVRE